MRKFWLICLILIISFFAFYIFQVNALASEQAQVQEEGQKIGRLKSENEILETKFTEKNSLEILERQIADLGFEKVEQPFYIKAFETWVAVK